MRSLLKRALRPLAVRYRRFMQAELLHEVLASRGGERAGDNTTMARNIEAALLTIALHAEEKAR